jgi:hypothetical protein
VTVETLGRAIDLYRRTGVTRSAVALLIANAIPVVGVLFFGWSLLTILVLYWLENGIVGFWNVPKIALARGSLLRVPPEIPDDAALAATGSPTRASALQAAWRAARARQLAALSDGPEGDAARAQAVAALTRLGAVPRVAMAGFFLLHYGIFWTVHGIFVFALPGFAGAAAGASPLSGESGAFGDVAWGNVALAAVALFISHGASFLFNYLGRREYLTASPASQMSAPYGRVVVLHMTIILGAFAVAILGAPIGALLVLVLLKTTLDLGLHLREHHPQTARPTGRARSP